jgi:hypothetical protein
MTPTEQVEYYRGECATKDAQLRALTEERRQQTSALADCRERLAALEGNLQRLTDESPFIEIERELILFTDVKWISTGTDGNLAKINGRDCWSSAVLARDLERLVSAHYQHRAPPRQE